jgi:4-amino-4-deoxy-L-arabinose transferase-like glycosyltransferase
MKMWQILLLLFTISFALRLYIDTSYFFWDESVYLLNAKWFAIGKSEYNEINSRPLLVSFFLSFFYGLKNFEVISRIILIFLNSLSIPVIFLLGREIKPKVGILSAVLLVFLPFHIQSSRWIMTDSINMLFIMLFILFLMRKKAVLSGLFAGLAFLTKYTSFIFIPIILIPFFYYFKKPKFFFKFFLGLTIIIPLLVFNLLYFGSMFNFLFSAIDAVSKKETVTLPFIAWLFYDLMGIILLPFFLLSIYSSLKFKKCRLFLFWLISFFFVSLLVINIGTDKPPSILWMVERFLLPLLPIVLVLTSYSIIELLKKDKFIIILLIVFIVFNIPNYSIAYTPSIEFEDGLRNVTKTMGIYIDKNLKENTTIHCTFNCPPIAWYSKRKTIVTNFKENSWKKLKENIYLIKYSNKLPNLEECFSQGFHVEKEIKDKEWSVYLLKK